VAAQRDLYAFCGPKVDKQLSDLESTLATHWAKLSGQRYPLDLGFKRGISLFISTLYLRHPSELERQRRFAASVATALNACPCDEAGKTLVSTIRFGQEEHRVAPADLEKFRTMTDSDIQAEWGKAILSETGYLAQALIKRPWTVLVADEPAFITTDNPVARVNTKRQDAPILNAQTTIYFPLSPKKLVIINYEKRYDGDIVLISSDQAAVFNHSIFRSAYRHVFSAWDSIHVMREVVQFHDQLCQMAQGAPDRPSGRVGNKIGRNELCVCGSGKKFKRCCGR
jgi:hypothetical protein